MARNRNYSDEFGRRQARARAQGWSGYPQSRYWQRRLTDEYVRQLAEQIGGPVEATRSGSLMSLAANAIVNTRDGARSPTSWQVRLLVAAGKIKAPAQI